MLSQNQLIQSVVWAMAKLVAKQKACSPRERQDKLNHIGTHSQIVSLCIHSVTPTAHSNEWWLKNVKFEKRQPERRLVSHCMKWTCLSDCQFQKVTKLVGRSPTQLYCQRGWRGRGFQIVFDDLTHCCGGKVTTGVKIKPLDLPVMNFWKWQKSEFADTNQLKINFLHTVFWTHS